MIANKKVTTTWDEKNEQNYVEYVSDGFTYKVWVEDMDSLRWRLDLVNTNDLAGVACWQKNFANSDVWNLIQQNNKESHYHLMMTFFMTNLNKINKKCYNKHNKKKVGCNYDE